MEGLAEVAAEIATEVTAKVLAEATSRTELDLNCGSGDP